MGCRISFVIELKYVARLNCNNYIHSMSRKIVRFPRSYQRCQRLASSHKDDFEEEETGGRECWSCCLRKRRAVPPPRRGIFCKLLYQSEFGAGHMAPGRGGRPCAPARGVRRLRRCRRGGTTPFTDVGGGLVRLHLRALPALKLRPETVARPLCPGLRRRAAASRGWKGKLALLRANAARAGPDWRRRWRRRSPPGARRATRRLSHSQCVPGALPSGVSPRARGRRRFLPLFQAIDALLRKRAAPAWPSTATAARANPRSARCSRRSTAAISTIWTTFSCPRSARRRAPGRAGRQCGPGALFRGSALPSGHGLFLPPLALPSKARSPRRCRSSRAPWRSSRAFTACTPSCATPTTCACSSPSLPRRRRSASARAAARRCWSASSRVDTAGERYFARLACARAASSPLTGRGVTLRAAYTLRFVPVQVKFTFPAHARSSRRISITSEMRLGGFFYGDKRAQAGSRDRGTGRFAAGTGAFARGGDRAGRGPGRDRNADVRSRSGHRAGGRAGRARGAGGHGALPGRLPAGRRGLAALPDGAGAAQPRL